MTNDIVRQARQTDLVQWLRMNSEPLKQAGRWWYIENHDSLRIQGNKWFHNSQGKGGNSIDFLVYYYNMTPKQAIIELTQSTCEYKFKEKRCGVKEKNGKESRFDFTSMVMDSEYRRVLAYLIKSRGIPSDVVMSEIESKHLYQEKGTANAIFAILDETGTIVGAEVSGTISYKNARYKSIKTGSLSGYGYNTGQRQNPCYILFFESAIDLLSFKAISISRSKSLNGCMLVSMAGLKPFVIEKTLQTFGSLDTIPVICVDNDTAADIFITRCLRDYPNALVRHPDCEYKDWNDQLCKISLNM